MITLRPSQPDDSPALLTLFQAQEQRQHQQDQRLALHTPQQIRAFLEQEPGFVALNSAGQIRGYVQPAIWEVAPDSILQAFLTPQNGTVRLVLPHLEEDDALEVLQRCLEQAEQYWQAHHTTGDLVRWPSTDPWIFPALTPFGFQLDSICAMHNPTTVTAAPKPATVRIRKARPTDEKLLLQLLEEELRYHEAYTPFVRYCEAAHISFQRALRRLWAGEPDAPIVFVAETQDTIIGMAENSLLPLTAEDTPGFVPAGIHWSIDNICVLSSWRGRGIGRQLLTAVFEKYQHVSPLHSMLLWYNPDNPQAAHFWQATGFRPLWTTYQRIHK